VGIYSNILNYFPRIISIIANIVVRSGHSDVFLKLPYYSPSHKKSRWTEKDEGHGLIRTPLQRLRD